VETELKPCPFCAHPAKLRCVEDVLLDPIYFVECGTCGATGSHRNTPFAAEEWWNGEHIETAKAEYEYDYGIR